MTPEVSVVVPTYRRPELLRRCLEALLRQDLPVESYEIVVADDGNDPATKNLVELLASQSAANLRYVPVRGPRHGPAAARNVGWKSAGAPIIAFTDDDCVPDPAWLREGLKSFADGVTAVRGRLIMPLPPVPTDYELNASGLATAEFVTANCLCRRSALEDIGGFDESFTKAWREDSDLHFRLIKNGRVARSESAKVVHPVRPAEWGVSLRQQRNNLFEALLYKKHPRMYRQVLGARPPWRYYAIVSAGAGAVALALTGRRRTALACAVLWAALTGRFMKRRLRGTSRAPRHVMEMAVTSALIPPVALYWRWRGAVRYRVPFL